MTSGQVLHLLTINTGSSSLKSALYRVDETVSSEYTAEADRIGQSNSRLRVEDAAGSILLDRHGSFRTHEEALLAYLDFLTEKDIGQRVDGVGHRVVHGGEKYREPVLVTKELVAALRSLIPVDPAHLPQAIEAIETTSRRLPGVPQVACFDTAFHRSMPRVAQMYGLPHRLDEEGVIRYGFHGLSYESILFQLSAIDAIDARMVLAHLGNGASMAAVRDGKGIDTTMGFSPTGGLVMGTRSGDLDPGVLLYLLQSASMSPAEINTLVNREAGLLGVSGVTADMQELLQRELAEPRIADAVELFCYQAKKFLGALVVTLGGLDTVVFTGGIGEHAAPVRERICEGLDFLGVYIDPSRNKNSESIISPEGGPVCVRVMNTDEDLMIARHTARLIRAGGEGHVPL